MNCIIKFAPTPLSKHLGESYFLPSLDFYGYCIIAFFPYSITHKKSQEVSDSDGGWLHGSCDMAQESWRKQGGGEGCGRALSQWFSQQAQQEQHLSHYCCVDG